MAAVDQEAHPLAVACQALAETFRGEGNLLAFGTGLQAADAQHVAVEFLHPVIVGRRSLPAAALTNDGVALSAEPRPGGRQHALADQVRALARKGDVALALDGPLPGPEVATALGAAGSAGLTSILLGSGPRDEAPSVDHVLWVTTDDEHVAREVHVTMYHVLWEMTHVFLDQRHAAPPTASAGVERLYPFLYDGGADQGAVVAEVARSTREKGREATSAREATAARSTAALVEAAEAIAGAAAGGGRVFLFGNGGSSTDAGAAALALARAGVPAVDLSADVATITALTNDVSFEVVFARQLRARGRAGDLAVGISTSGGSANVLAGLSEARSLGMVTVGLAGYDGGEMAGTDDVDHLLAVPSSSVHRIQEVQTTLYHLLAELVESLLAV